MFSNTPLNLYKKLLDFFFSLYISYRKQETNTILEVRMSDVSIHFIRPRPINGRAKDTVMA